MRVFYFVPVLVCEHIVAAKIQMESPGKRVLEGRTNPDLHEGFLHAQGFASSHGKIESQDIVFSGDVR